VPPGQGVVLSWATVSPRSVPRTTQTIRLPQFAGCRRSGADWSALTLGAAGDLVTCPSHGVCPSRAQKKLPGRNRIPTRKCATAKTADFGMSIYCCDHVPPRKSRRNARSSCPRLPSDYTAFSSAMSTNPSANSPRTMKKLTSLLLSIYVFCSIPDHPAELQVILPAILGLGGCFLRYFGKFRTPLQSPSDSVRGHHTPADPNPFIGRSLRPGVNNSQRMTENSHSAARLLPGVYPPAACRRSASCA
jgi:hypothetical protein